MQKQVTQVDPNGLARLYLRTPEIPDFFQAQQQYYRDLEQQYRAKRKKLLWGTAALGGALIILALTQLRGDEQGALTIFSAIGTAIALVIVGVVFSGKIQKVKIHEAKSQMLDAFFANIAEDLHPDSGLKGTLNHGEPQKEDIYKRKTSPHSGAKKIYYKFAWANLKFMLIDGTTLRIRCTDKLKKKSGTVVRFEEIGKARVAPNTVLYDLMPGQQLNLRKDLCASENSMIKHAPQYGITLASTLKTLFQNKLKRRPNIQPQSQSPAQPQVQSQAVAASEASSEAPKIFPLHKVRRLLEASALPLQVEGLGKETLEVRYTSPKGEHVLWIDVKADNETPYVGVRLPILGDAPAAERLLKANPALAYGRFTYITQKNSGGKQLCLFKSLLWETLDREELETAIQGLCQLSNHLARHELPSKTRAYRAEREPDWEHSLLESVSANLPLLAPVEYLENKAKLRLQLPDQRQQTVHIRFDRQDHEGNQLITLLSYCGADSPDMYDLALEENSAYSYGALGLGTLGETPMFVVSDNQLAETADPPEIEQAILHIARKADAVEALLTGADVH